MGPNSEKYIAKCFILKVEVGWSKAGGCGSDGALFSVWFFFWGGGG